MGKVRELILANEGGRFPALLESFKESMIDNYVELSNALDDVGEQMKRMKEDADLVANRLRKLNDQRRQHWAAEFGVQFPEK
jgi:hypothetical protein